MDNRQLIDAALGHLRARKSPLDFMVEADPRMKRFWHTEAINDAFMKVYRGEILRLCISVPPRHGKSEQVSRYGTAWWLGMRPDDRIMFAAYESDFAADWGRKSRDTLDEHGHLLGVKVSPRSSAANRWDIEGKAGGMITAGTGGSFTGRGANLLIIDDPIKNNEDAFSKLERDKAYNWYYGTVYDRLENNVETGQFGAVILIMQRWHDDDLAGRLLAEPVSNPRFKWHSLVLPAIAEEDEEHRKAGEALCPQLHPLEELIDKRDHMPQLFWLSKYQQKPSPEDGTMFKRNGERRWVDMGEDYELRFADGSFKRVAKGDCWKFATVDLAVSQKTSADFTVMAAWAVTPQRELILIDLIRKRMEGPDQVPTLLRFMQDTGAAYAGIESVAFQLSAVQSARRAGVSVKEIKRGRGDKFGRAIAAGQTWNAGGIYIPANASWATEYVDELVRFGPHDDQIDVTSDAVAEMMLRGMQRPGDMYGLVNCHRCNHRFIRNRNTGLDRPCPQCGAGPEPEEKAEETVNEAAQ